MNVKKIGLLLVSVIMVFSLILSSCKATETSAPTEVPEPTEKPKPTEAPPPTEVPPPTEAPPEEVTIRLAFWELGGLITPRMQFAVDHFNETFPNIKVEFVASPEAFTHRDTVLTMIAAGDPPDVVWMGDTAIADFVSRGALLDITPFIERDNLDMSMFVPAVEDARVEGKYYGLPDHGGPIVVYYNKDLYDASGLEYPIKEPTDDWTWDTFLSNAHKLTKVGADGRIEVFGMDPWIVWFHWIPTVWTFGGEVISEDLTKSGLDGPEAKEAIQTIADTILKEPVVAPLNFTEIGMDLLTLLLNSRCAHLGAGAWGPSLFTNPQTKEPVINWDIVPYPVKKEFRMAAGYVQWVIPAGSKHTDEAWELLKFLASDLEVQRDVASRGIGIPGLLEAGTYGDYLMPYEPKSHLKVWENTILRSGGWPYHPQWTRTIEGVVTEELTLIWTGDKSVEDGMNDAARRMNEVLAEPIQ